jgi:WD40-like Beta Propeller Repeat
VKRELQRVEIPGEYEARRRTWEVVRAAYLERRPVSWPRRHARSLALTAAVVAIVAAAVTPPGRSVVNSIRDAVGREKVAGVRNAQRELVRLPAPGRLLVQSPRAAWVVQQDGSRRRLGPYRDVAWSPHGLFVAGVLNRRDLVAIEPNGKVRWEKPNKRRVAFPRWSFDGFRIAYFVDSALRVIAGDGTNDRPIGPASSSVAPAWRPGTHQVAYVGPGGLVRVVDADARTLLWQTPPEANGIRALTWSDDGARLLVLGDHSVSVYSASGRVVGRTPTKGAVEAAAFAPGSHRFALTVGPQLLVVDGDTLRFPNRPIFTGAPTLGDIAWSPDGRWLLIGWPAADQLVFIRRGAAPKLEAVSNASRQFRSRMFPGLGGWTVSID